MGTEPPTPQVSSFKKWPGISSSMLTKSRDFAPTTPFFEWNYSNFPWACQGETQKVNICKCYRTLPQGLLRPPLTRGLSPYGGDWGRDLRAYFLSLRQNFVLTPPSSEGGLWTLSDRPYGFSLQLLT